MQDTPYWNPRHETLPREELAALQLRRLRRLVGWAAARSPFHRARLEDAGASAESLASLDDLRRLPFMTREEWMEAQLAGPPYGSILSVPPTVAVRYHMTSGTSGSTPIRVLDSLRDWEWIAEGWCYGLWGFGVRPHDVVFVAFGYSTFIGFWGLHYGCEKLGSLVLPGGAMSTRERLRTIVEMQATVVCSTPTYALRMAQEAAALGIDLPASPVKRLILSGEPAGSIPATKRLLEGQWGAKVGDTAGMTELGTIFTFECAAQPGGTHVIEDQFIEEVIDPESGEPVGYGEMGERVVTSFGRATFPVLRYRTRDLVVKVPAERCSCGRSWDLYEGGIRGRVDDMKLVRGTNIYPRAVEAIVREHPEVEEFQLRLYTADGIRDEIELRVEVGGDRAAADALCAALAVELAAAHEGLRFGVRRVDAGTLPRFELKAKRVVDERLVIGGGGERRTEG